MKRTLLALMGTALLGCAAMAQGTEVTVTVDPAGLKAKAELGQALEITVEDYTTTEEGLDAVWLGVADLVTFPMPSMVFHPDNACDDIAACERVVRATCTALNTGFQEARVVTIALNGGTTGCSGTCSNGQGVQVKCVTPKP